MCSPAFCQRCGKATWAGCGEHVEQVMRGVPKAQQCACASSPSAAAGQRWAAGDGRGFPR